MTGIVVKDGGGRKKYYGIGAEAKRLGVRYEHLWMVLEGRRESKRIMDEVHIRYEKSANGEAK